MGQPDSTNQVMSLLKDYCISPSMRPLGLSSEESNRTWLSQGRPCAVQRLHHDSSTLPGPFAISIKPVKIWTWEVPHPPISLNRIIFTSPQKPKGWQNNPKYLLYISTFLTHTGPLPLPRSDHTPFNQFNLIYLKTWLVHCNIQTLSPAISANQRLCFNSFYSIVSKK